MRCQKGIARLLSEMNTRCRLRVFQRENACPTTTVDVKMPTASALKVKYRFIL